MPANIFISNIEDCHKFLYVCSKSVSYTPSPLDEEGIPPVNYTYTLTAYTHASHGVVLNGVHHLINSGVYIMANTRLAFGNILGTVVDAANTVSTTLNVVTKSVGMVDAFVSNAAETQRIRMKLEQSSRTEQLIEETALADTQRQQGIKDYLEANPGTSDMFSANQARLTAVLAAK